MKNLKSLIISNIDEVINLYEPYLNELSEVEKEDIEQLKICSMILCSKNKSFNSDFKIS